MFGVPTTNKQTNNNNNSHVPHHQVHFKAKQRAPQTYRQHLATILEHLNDDTVKEEPKKNTLEKQVLLRQPLHLDSLDASPTTALSLSLDTWQVKWLPVEATIVVGVEAGRATTQHA